MLNRLFRSLVAAAAVACCVEVPISVSQLSAQTSRDVDFARDVQPLLRANCYGCHGPTLQNGNLRLDRRRDAMPNRVGANGARIVPGNSGVSRVYLRVSGTTAGLQMPPSGALPSEQIATIKAWIDQGAEWPDALAGDTPSPPQDPQAVRLMEALRTGHRTEFERALQASPSAAKSRGVGGSTPLMFAALYGDATAMRLLLDSGADADARNDAGATALLWAVDDVEKTRLLLSHGADPNVRSDDGATPLLLAAGRFGSLDIVKALLDGGAKLAGQPAFGRAAGAGDEAVMRLLLERGAPRTNSGRDLSFAMRSSCSRCVDLLLESASGDVQRQAVGSENASDAQQTGAAVAAPLRSTPPLSPRAAAERSLPGLQRADVAFLKTAGCVSCHNNSLFQMATAVARSRGFQVDEATDAAQQRTMGAYIASWRERLLQDIPIPGAVDTVSFMLAGLADVHYPPDAGTDAMARYLLRRQDRDGGWRIATSRPPLESSNVSVTALVVRGLQAYAPAPNKEAYVQSARRAVAWLRAAEPLTTEDHAFQVLGLAWARDDRRQVSDAAGRLAALQRNDGGWSQLATLQSDAYATGQALTALAASGMSVKDAIYQRGVAFLLRTQLEDGSWFVHSRAVPIQPYFDSGFPHGRDQFISAAATNWAAMALMLAAR